jgi:uncharacterized protein (TIGR02284 family)
MQEANNAKRLNELLTRNYDAERGYEEAAEQVENPGLKEFFKYNSRERNDFGHEIKQFLKQESIQPDKGTSLKADAHRAFIKLKDLVSSSSTQAVLEECERGEKVALNDYEAVIADEAVPNAYKPALSNQLNAINKSIDQIEKLKRTLA